MGDGLEKYQSRRILTDKGWMFFCRICGDYQPESQFYKKKGSKWGLAHSCKIHSTRKGKDDKDMEHIKFDPLTESDFIESKKLLQRLGYDIHSDVPIHVQFSARMEVKNRVSGATASI